MTGEVSALEHEVGNHTVEGTACVSLYIHVSHTPTGKGREEVIRSRFDRLPIRGSSWPSWERHHRTTYYTTISVLSPSSSSSSSSILVGGGIVVRAPTTRYRNVPL